MWKRPSRTEESHTHVEWLRFLKQIDRETPRDLDLHLIIVITRHINTRSFSAGSKLTDLALQITQSCEERDGAVADIIVGLGAAVAFLRGRGRCVRSGAWH
jgi:hypothetical protein